MVKAAMLAGGVGGTIGRNIWQAKNPTRMAAALVSVIHPNATVDEAMEILTQT